MNYKPLLAITLGATLVLGCLAGCSSSSTTSEQSGTSSASNSSTETSTSSASEARDPLDVSTITATNETSYQKITEQEFDDLSALVVDGKTYTVPASVSDFTNNGWVGAIISGESESVEAGKSTSAKLYKGSSGSADKIQITCYNDSTSTKSWDECGITHWWVDFNLDTPTSTYATSKGVGIGSSAEEVVAAYGNPTMLQEMSSTCYLDYKYDVYDLNIPYCGVTLGVSFEIDINTNSVVSMEIGNA